MHNIILGACQAQRSIRCWDRLEAGERKKYYFFHRAFAAFLAIVFRFLADSFAALALPPFKPPRRPRVIAAVLITAGSRGEPSRCSPMARSTTLRAMVVKSRCFGVDTGSSISAPERLFKGWEFQTDPLPEPRCATTGCVVSRIFRECDALAPAYFCAIAPSWSGYAASSGGGACTLFWLRRFISSRAFTAAFPRLWLFATT
jgi:hypothetical protein